MTATQAIVKRNGLRDILSKSNLSAVRGAFALSFLNQIVSSGGNFAVGIYLARTLPLADFGLYGMGFAICLLYVGLGNAIILTQMIVTMPDKPPAEREDYASRMLMAVLLLNLVALGLALLALAAAVFWRPELLQYRDAAGAIGLAAMAFLLKEFFISYAFMKRREALALTVSVVTVVVLCGGLAVLHIGGVALMARDVLLLYAAGALTGSVVAYAASPLRLSGGARNPLPDLAAAWGHGRWALGGVSVTWIQAQAYTYVLAFFLGPVGVGMANAAKIFITPFSFIIPAINKMMVPRLADLRQSNPERMLRLTMLVTSGLFGLAILYSIVLLSNLDVVARLILGRNDPAIESLVWIWCVVLAVQMTLTGGSALMQVMRRFRVLTLINIPTAVVTVVAALVMIRLAGTSGAIWALFVGETMLALLVWRNIRYGRGNSN